VNADNIIAQYLECRTMPDGKSRLFMPGSEEGYYGPSLSPSAMSTAEECMHKWALSRLDNVPRPINYQAERGTTVHAQLEAWLKTGSAPTTQNMAKVFTHFPAPGTCETEGEFGFILGRPGKEFVVKGRFDAREKGVVYDLKTTGDMRWKKTPAQLEVDLQASVYALAEMLRNNLDSVTCRWVYAQVPSPIRYLDNGEIDDEGSLHECRSPEFEIKRAEPVEMVLTRERVMLTLAEYVPLAERMMEAIDEKKRAADLPKEASACESYGGCPFKKSGACEVPAGGGFLALVKQETQKAARAETEQKKEKKMGLLSKFAKTTTETTTTAAAPPPAPKADKVEVVASVVTAPPEKTEKAEKAQSNLMARLAQVTGGGAKTAAVEKALDAAPTHDVRAVGINPPDAAPVWTPEEQAKKSEEIVAGVKAPKGTDALPAESITAQTVAAQDQEVEAAKAAEKDAKKAAKEAKKAAKGTVATTTPTTPALPGNDDDMLAVLTRIANALERIASK
jgi:hypothetical protein